MSELVPELDASGQRFNIRMREGDPVNWQWIVEGGVAWVGTYVVTVLVGNTEVSLDSDVSASGADALFVIQDTVQPLFVPTASGYPWDIQAVGGITRFAGLLFVDAEA